MAAKEKNADISINRNNDHQNSDDEIKTQPIKIKTSTKPKEFIKMDMDEESDDESSDSKDDDQENIDVSLGTESETTTNNDDGTISSSQESSRNDEQKTINNSIQQKNKYIKEILHDLQKSEEENKTLRVELSRVKDKLSEATANIQKQTILITNTKSENTHYLGIVNKLKEVQSVLQSQIETLTESNKKSESQLDEFIVEMDSRINDWEDVLITKETEINQLKNEINQLEEKLGLMDQRDPEFFNEMIKQRDMQIDDLQTKLSEATENIMITSQTLENLKKHEGHVKVANTTLTENVDDSNLNKFKSEFKKITVLNEDLEYCIKLKEEELADALEKLSIFENGDFGLKEAIQANKRCKQQLKIRDEQIKTLVSENNNYVKTLGQLQLENSVMRKKLNLPPEQIITADNLLSKYSKLKKELSISFKKISLLDEQNVSLKIRLRQKEKTIQKLYNYVKNLGIKIPDQFLAVILVEDNISQQAFEADNQNINSMSEDMADTGHISDTEIPDKNISSDENNRNYKLLLDENQHLKNRLIEIYNTLKDRASGITQETIPLVVEEILQLLNIENINEPHIKLSQELNIEQENHEKFKIMLKDARFEILSTLELLTKESQKNLLLQQKLTEMNSQKNIEKEEIVETKPDEKKSDKSEESIASSDDYLHAMNQPYSSILHENLKHFHDQFKYLYDCMTELFNENYLNKNQLISMEEKYKTEIEELKNSLHSMEIKCNESNKIISTLKNTEDNTDVDKIDYLQQYPQILSEKEYYNRKSIYLEDSLKSLYSEHSNLKMQSYKYKVETMEKVKHYEIEIQKYKYNVANVKNELRNSVSMENHLKLNLKFNELETKYRKIINDEFKSSIRNETIDDSKTCQCCILSEKNDLLEKDIIELHLLLKNEKEKNFISDKFDSVDDRVKLLSSQLSECQVNNISLNEKSKHLITINTKLSSQIETLYEKLRNVNEIMDVSKSRIEFLEKENLTLQDNQNSLINKAQIACLIYEPNNNAQIIDSVHKLNENLKLENQELKCKLSALEEQINTNNQAKLTNDLEINILRHQILDLQSGNDNKAIVARLSGEILVSHIHTTELHNKKEKLIRDLESMKIKYAKLEETLHEKDVQFDNFVTRTNFKICFLSSALQVMKEQYSGSIPLTILENITNTQIEIQQKMNMLKNREIELEELERNLENDIFGNILQNIKVNKCTYNDNAQCPHFIEMKLKESKWDREKYNFSSRYENLKQSYEQLETKISKLEENFLLLSFIFDKNNINKANDEKKSPIQIKRTASFVELTDVNPDDLNESQSPEQYYPIPRPRTFARSSPLQQKVQDSEKIVSVTDDNLPGSPIKMEKKKPESVNKIPAIIQTDMPSLRHIALQTDKSEDLNKLLNGVRNELQHALSLASERYEKIVQLENDNVTAITKCSALEKSIQEKEMLIKDMKKRSEHVTDSTNIDSVNDIDNLKELLKNLQSIESEKDTTINQYKELLENEKSEHNKTSVIAQNQIIDMKIKIETLENEHKSLKDLVSKPSHIEAYNTSMEKYRSNVLSLEDQCFQLHKDLENSHGLLLSTKSECERWKNLAAERFSNMEVLNKRLEERHMNEVTSYKTETHHWISELSNCQKELSETKLQFNEYRTNSLKEISERHMIIERINTDNSQLKEQILNLQAVISMTDPTFEFAAIEEITTIDKSSFQSETRNVGFTDVISNNSVVNQASTKSIWSDALFDRLRREKQMLTRQNILLRKQIKVLSARERRSRLELQNNKSQMSKKNYTSASSNKFTFDHNEKIDILLRKIDLLESQLSEKKSATMDDEKYREKQLVLWDKQKRWQESSEKWKQQYLDKCEQYDKLIKNFNASKAIVQRLEKDKRVLDSRLSKYSRDEFTPSTMTGESDGHLEMLLRDKERLENEVCNLKAKLEGNIKHSSLLERLEIQQRRIAALELAERGKDVLVNEYERLLAQNSLLAKQNIKLESEILEVQLSSVGKRLEPDGSDGENSCCRRFKQQIEHLETYIKLLKEENSQLIAKNIESNSLTPQSTTGTLSQAKRIADLERTVLTLRGLVSKMQADNKRLMNHNDKIKDSATHVFRERFVEEMKVEMERMKMVIRDKDELLERSKDLLRKAAEKERQYANEIAILKQTRT